MSLRSRIRGLWRFTGEHADLTMYLSTLAAFVVSVGGLLLMSDMSPPGFYDPETGRLRPNRDVRITSLDDLVFLFMFAWFFLMAFFGVRATVIGFRR